MFLSSGVGEIHSLLGSLERANLIHWTTHTRVRVRVILYDWLFTDSEFVLASRRLRLTTIDFFNRILVFVVLM
jgi:hypothetical protein